VGGPTDDQPAVTLAPSADSDDASAFLNIRVADIGAAYAEWSAKDAEFLTEPKEHAAYTVREAVDDWLLEGLAGTSQRTRTLRRLAGPVLEVIDARPCAS
jgi:hypothetical protein